MKEEDGEIRSNAGGDGQGDRAGETGWEITVRWENAAAIYAAMADAGGKSDWQNQIGPAKDSVLDMIRVACYVHQPWR